MISTALRTGHPLPQITPCPLLDRYMQNQHGLNIVRQEADDHYGLPRTMTIDTLANEQYMYVHALPDFLFFDFCPYAFPRLIWLCWSAGASPSDARPRLES